MIEIDDEIINFTLDYVMFAIFLGFSIGIKIYYSNIIFSILRIAQHIFISGYLFEIELMIIMSYS